MNRDEIIEAMARKTMPFAFGDEPALIGIGALSALHFASKYLTALETAIPGLADVIAGKAVIVPVEPTETMMEAAQEMAISGKEWCFEDAYRAMIEARPK